MGNIHHYGRHLEVLLKCVRGQAIERRASYLQQGSVRYYNQIYEYGGVVSHALIQSSLDT